MSSCVAHSHSTCQKEQMIHGSGARAAQRRRACQLGNRRIITIHQDLVPYDSLPQVINGYCQATPHPRWAHCPSLCTSKTKLYFLGGLEMTNAKLVLENWLFLSPTCFPALPRIKGKTCLLSVMEVKNVSCSIRGSVHTPTAQLKTDSNPAGVPGGASRWRVSPGLPQGGLLACQPSPGTSPSSARLFPPATQVRQL